MEDDVVLRPGGPADLAALTDLYNHYVVETPFTFDTRPFATEERRAWLEQFSESGPHRLIVAERPAGVGQAGQLLGFVSSHAFRVKAAYDTSIETTIYLDPTAVGRGVGTRLYAALFEALRGEDLHRAYAGIAQPNPASTALHEKLGFTQVALYHEVGRKFDRYWDVAWFERHLGS